MTNGTTLPPLPASDQHSLSRNRYDQFYKVTTRNFWGDNKLVSEKPQAFRKCKHYFAQKPNSVECEKCHFGLIGFFKIKNGKLYHQGKALKI